MIRRTLPELFCLACLFALPLLLFAPVALGPKTLLPADSLALFEPYRSAALDQGEGLPQNHLLADLILQNYAWKHFLVEALHIGEMPLWDPYVFAGHPFLAGGQHSAIYPLSVVFYILPLWRAFGVFVWLQLGIAGANAFLFARVVGVRRPGALIAGITFQLSGFMVVSVVHPMIIAGASWLPFIMAMIELVVRQQPVFSRRPATLPWVALGALGLGCQTLAGHAENTYLVVLVSAFYALWRLVFHPRTMRHDRKTSVSRPILWVLSRYRATLALVAMLCLGLALGAVQLVPLFELVRDSFRGGEAAASLEQVLKWGYPWRRLITFAIPNFFGNPSHHGYYDLFTWRWTPAPTFLDGQYIDWGIKNYVEGGAYLGLLPLFLALAAIASASRFRNAENHSRKGCVRRTVDWFHHPQVPFFTLLAVFSVGCVFGTPVYGAVYVLPLINQSHSPFRWVFPLTLAVSVLAGFGVQAVSESGSRQVTGQERRRGALKAVGSARPSIGHWFFLRTPFSPVSLSAALAFWGGLFSLTGLVLSRLFFTQIEPGVEWAFRSLAKASAAFPDHRAFYSYEFRWVALFGLMLTGTGIVLRVSRCSIFIRRRPVWEGLAVILLALDLVAFGAGFNPAVDRELLEYTPPVVDFLRQDSSLWRYATFTPPGTTKTMNANVGMLYGLQTVAGYDSLFSRRYAEYLALIEEQDELPFNRIASFSEWTSLDSPLTDLLNVKYVVTEVEIPSPKYRLVYEDDAVRVYENLAAMSRAYTLPIGATVENDDLAQVVQDHDLRSYVVVDAGASPFPVGAPQAGSASEQDVTRYSFNEVEIAVTAEERSWLILTDAHSSGWKAFVRPRDADQQAEEPVVIHRANGVFRAMLVEPGIWTLRLKYSPDSVKVGAFVTFVGGMVVLFLVGLHGWRFFYREEDDRSTVRRVAKNSLAPIAINLFNRGIEMAFAALVARILGPAGNGRYATAINIYLLFDTIANFGLDMYVIREVARDRAGARKIVINTTALRLLLFVGIVPLLGTFLAGRQAWGTPLSFDTIWAVVLLAIGLLPGSVANGVAALFRGWEKHEIPAAVQTVTTIIRVSLGVLALVGGLGILGLAGASILTNVVTLVILSSLAKRMIWSKLSQVRGRLAWSLQRAMLAESWPLMAALLLQALFTGVNVLLLQQIQGDEVVGWYDAARKWVDALNIIPSVFTFAVFPVMSRQASKDRSGLGRSYLLSLKLLFIIALPVAVLITSLSTQMVGALSGREFLPAGARILQILIWSIVFGWFNSLTNYVLIALNRQRYVLMASGVRVIFTVVANVLLVVKLGYAASAWIIIGGELLLASLFYADARRQLGAVDLGHNLGRPALAGVAMGGIVSVLASFSTPLSLLIGIVIYVLALAVLRAMTPEELQMLSPVLPSLREQQR